MAWRYQKHHFQDGDIAHPRHWNENIQQFTDEYNGYLDKDNLPRGAIKSEMVSDHAFSRVYLVTAAGYGNNPELKETYVAPVESHVWVSTDNNSMDLCKKTIDVETDCIAIVEFTCNWDWRHDAANDGGTTSNNDAFSWGGGINYRDAVDVWIDDPDDEFGHLPLDTSIVGDTGPLDPVVIGGDLPKRALAVRVTVDGVPISETGRLHAGNCADGTYIVGATSLQPGSHVFQAEARIMYLDSSQRDEDSISNRPEWDTESAMKTAADETDIDADGNIIYRVGNVAFKTRAMIIQLRYR